jgi:hypothetical protein
MSVLGAGNGSPKRPIDLENLGNMVKERSGRFTVSFRSMIMSSGYTDAMLAVSGTTFAFAPLANFLSQHFAARNPSIAFTHIHPGVVKTSALRVDFDGIFTPLSWLLNLILPLFAVSQVRAACGIFHLWD